LFDRSSSGFGEMVRAIDGVRDGVWNVLWGGPGSVIRGTETQACGKYLTLALKGLIYMGTDPEMRHSYSHLIGIKPYEI